MGNCMGGQEGRFLGTTPGLSRVDAREIAATVNANTQAVQVEAVKGRKRMPFKSQAQRGYFGANRAKLEGQGVNVDEWMNSSKGLSLPKKLGSGLKKQPAPMGAMKWGMK